MTPSYHRISFHQNVFGKVSERVHPHNFMKRKQIKDRRHKTKLANDVWLLSLPTLSVAQWDWSGEKTNVRIFWEPALSFSFDKVESEKDKLYWVFRLNFIPCVHQHFWTFHLSDNLDHCAIYAKIANPTVFWYLPNHLLFCGDSVSAGMQLLLSRLNIEQTKGQKCQQRPGLWSLYKNFKGLRCQVFPMAS